MSMAETKESVRAMIAKYGKDIEELCRYLPWLESKKGQDVGGKYEPGEGKANTISVPTYDSNLLAFVKKVQKTGFYRKNYVYTYSHNHIRTAEDEHRMIDKCSLMEIETIGDIVTSYVMKGMTKAYMWTEGVKNGVFFHAVSRMKELVDFWSA